jgi:hypothetical protein
MSLTGMCEMQYTIMTYLLKKYTTRYNPELIRFVNEEVQASTEAQHVIQYGVSNGAVIVSVYLNYDNTRVYPKVLGLSR